MNTKNLSTPDAIAIFLHLAVGYRVNEEILETGLTVICPCPASRRASLYSSCTNRVQNRICHQLTNSKLLRPDSVDTSPREATNHATQKKCILPNLCTVCGRLLLRLKRMTSRIAVLRAFWAVVGTVARARRAYNVEIFVSTA